MSSPSEPAGPNPSLEAYADTAPLRALVGGWIPGMIFTGLFYLPALVANWFFGWLARRCLRPATRSMPSEPISGPGDSSGELS